MCTWCMLQHGMPIWMNVIVTACFKWPGNHFKQLTHTPISFVFYFYILAQCWRQSVRNIMGNVEGYQQVFLNNCGFPRKCDIFILNFSGFGFHTSDVYVVFLKTYYFFNYSILITKYCMPHSMSTAYCWALDSLFYVKVCKLAHSPFVYIDTAFLFMSIDKEGASGNTWIRMTRKCVL